MSVESRPRDSLAEALGPDPDPALLTELASLRFAAQNPPVSVLVSITPQGAHAPPLITVMPTLEMSYETIERILSVGVGEVRRLERMAYAEQLRATETGGSPT